MYSIDRPGWLNWPNALSFAALLTAWGAILLLLRGFFYLSFALALVALVLDAFDGLLARKLHQESEFGRQLDSHVDVFIYLLYPALACYLPLALRDIFSVIAISVFLAAGVFRLVRFTLQGFAATETGARAYSGLPVYYTHLLLLALVALKLYGVPYFDLIAGGALLAAAALMVSTVKVPKPVSVPAFAALLLGIAILFGFMEFYGNHQL
jgi:CDP-diacylglycerol--serine O-phosphatidyltransferase